MRALPFLLEPVGFLLIGLIVITQVVIPILRGTKTFPFFRKRAKLEERLTELREESDEVDLEKEVERAVEAVKKKRQPENQNPGPNPATKGA